MQIVRGVYAQWERGNMRAGGELFDPEISFEAFMPDANDVVVAHGPEGIKVFMREFLAQWTDYGLVGDEFRDADTKVLVAGRQRAQGRQSGVEVEFPMHSIWTFRDGRVVGLRFTPSMTEALEAAGLRE